jgi:hypothetical protein
MKMNKSTLTHQLFSAGMSKILNSNSYAYNTVKPVQAKTTWMIITWIAEVMPQRFFQGEIIDFFSSFGLMLRIYRKSKDQLNKSLRKHPRFFAKFAAQN